jgi:hypothetical protein
MKTMKILRLATVLCSVFLFASCEKPDSFEDTDSGKNTLGFLLNGKKVEYSWQPFIPIAPIVYNESVSAREYGDTLEIFACLSFPDDFNDYDFCKVISINLPVSQLISGAVLENVADIQLPYYADRETDSDGVTHFDGRMVDVSSSRVNIRTCKPKDMISGTFEFDGDAEYADGTKRHCVVNNGHFDVKWSE